MEDQKAHIKKLEKKIEKLEDKQEGLKGQLQEREKTLA